MKVYVLVERLPEKSAHAIVHGVTVIPAAADAWEAGEAQRFAREFELSTPATAEVN